MCPDYQSTIVLNNNKKLFSFQTEPKFLTNKERMVSL